MTENKTNVKAFAVIAGKLLVICAVVAALVASVNLITKDKIALNQKLKTAEALTHINSAEGLFFSVDETGAYVITDANGEPAGVCELADVKLLTDIDGVYIIKDNSGNVLSYCVEASPMGFKNDVGILVAVTPDVTIKDVQIISISDTKGIGDKVAEKDYLDLYKGKQHGFSESTDALKKSGMIIAGATRTSEPVSLAIDKAVGQVAELVFSLGTAVDTQTEGGETDE